MYKKAKSYELRLLRYILLSFFLTIMNTLFITNTLLSITLAVSETLILLYYLVFKSTDKFILCFLLFVSCVVESNVFALGDSEETIYSFINLPGIHFYHLFFILLIAYIKLHISSFENTRASIRSLSSKILILFVMEIGVTCISLILNDNGVLSSEGLLRFVIIDCYNTYWICIVFAILWECLIRNDVFEVYLKTMLMGILAGVSLASVFLLIMGSVNTVNSDVVNLISPLSLFFAPALLLCCFSEKRALFLVLGVAASAIQMRFSLGIPGAWWLFFASIIIVFAFRSIKTIRRRMSAVKVIAGTSICTIMAVAVVCILTTGITLKLKNSYISYKLTTVFNLFTFNEEFSEWYIGLGASIGVRLEEIVNIILEFIAKPGYILFGKGYGGSVVKYWGINNWNISGSTFPDAMIMNGVYMLFHTGTAELLINFGLIGLFLNLLILKICVDEVFREDASEWILIGSMWMFTLLYSYKTMVIGMASLCYGLYLRRHRSGKSGLHKNFRQGRV